MVTANAGLGVVEFVRYGQLSWVGMAVKDEGV